MRTFYHPRRRAADCPPYLAEYRPCVLWRLYLDSISWCCPYFCVGGSSRREYAVSFSRGAGKGSNRRLEFELDAWFVRFCVGLGSEPDDGARTWPLWPCRSAPAPQST